MRNIVDAILAIVADPKCRLKEYANTHNRVNHMGVALEEYIKDLFAGAVGESSDQARLKLISENFSFLGNTNNPPDSMLRGGGDAIEVKKKSPTIANWLLIAAIPNRNCIVIVR